MVTAAMQEKDSYLERFACFEPQVAGRDWAPFQPVRRAAMARFAELGFPTTQDEDWRFTSVAPIARTAFALSAEGGVVPGRRDLEPFTFAGLDGSQLVFVNGRYAPELSSLRSLPAGVAVGSLAGALTMYPDLMEAHLARYADYQRDAFTALNTAFMEDGAFVHIRRGVVLSEPIHLLYVSTETSAPLITHPRNLIVAGEDSQATVVEDYVSLGGGVSFSNGVTEVVVGQSGVLSHYLIERESPQAFNVSTLRIQQDRSSSVTSHSVLVGGALVRNNVHPVLAGEGGECLINGLFMATGRQHMDNYMRVEHAAPHCDSRQFYHGILDGASRGVFHGRIIVHKDAQKTDAKQTNRNLLLSEDAQIDTKPQLEIYADDVKCTHGATIGQVNEEAIFYLRSRGIAKDAARALLLFAFAEESLQRMKVEPIRRHLEGLVSGWLPQGSLLEAVR
jgi:Fe-S cluster assembly protein SufD